MVATRIETAAHQPADRFSIMPILNRKKKMCPELKVIVLGNAGVGKTSLLNSLTDSSAKKPSDLDFRVKMASLNAEIVKLQLWDTADQEKHGATALPKSYYRRARGVFLVYDASDRQSFRDVTRWATDLNVFRDDNEPLSVVLVANKTDRRHSVVSTLQGQALATLLDACFVECMAGDGSTSCMEQLIADMSKDEKPWSPDLHDLPTRLDSIEALSLVEKTPTIVEDAESETESESDEWETECDKAMVLPTKEPELPNVDKIVRRRDSRLFAELELGSATSTAADNELGSSRALTREALVAGSVLLVTSPLGWLLLDLRGGPCDLLAVAVRAIAWSSAVQ